MSDALTDIAIIGMAGRFPGARDINEFWRNLCAGVESITHFAPGELEIDDAAAVSGMPNYVRARAIIEDADKFDAAFFGIYPKEAELIDPQQRMFLECCWHAFEDSGYDPLVYTGITAVFAGCSFNSYFAQHVCSNRDDISQYTAGYQVSNFITTLGSNFEFLPTRVAYKLNLRGPAFSLNCGCSTSLVAVSQACLSLQNYQCDMALAGGVSITFPQRRGYLYEPGGMVSPDGHCRTFDAASQGTVFGDGAAVVLLKRFQEAVADRDRIYAVIKGFGVTNDGAAKVGFTAPGVDGQASAIAMAHSAAGVDPASISYIEAHGTGTPLGDPIEIAALTQAFRRSTTRRQFCALGTAKTNVGHLDVAAGVTGLIKTAMSLHHRMLPPTLHFESANPKLNLEDSPFYVNTALSPWQRGTTPLRAGVSAFGIGGTNAHVVMEEAPEALATKSRRGAHLILVSAKTEAALNAATSNLADSLVANPTAELADVAYTLMMGRHSFEARRMTVIHDTADAVTVLAGGSRRVLTRITPSNRLAVAFMFPGQGSQYVGMGRQLYFAEPEFRKQVDICLQILVAGSGPNLRNLFDSNYTLPTDEEINDTAIAQPALFVVEYALAQLWLQLGIRPQAMIGHSIGEFVAACMAGVFSLEDALKLVAGRGALMHDLPRGAMLSVRLSEDDVARFIGPAANLAAVNGPSLTVVAGPCEAIAELEQRLGSEGIVCQRLRTSHAFHSSMMDTAREPFLRLLDPVRISIPEIPFLSSVTGDWITAREATDPEYWANHLRLPVRFSIGAAKLRAEDFALLEVGPGNTLSVLARQHQANNPDQLVIASMPGRNGQQTEEESVLNALGQLWLHGAQPNWSQIYAGDSRRRVSLPLYPFERKRFWCGPRPAARNADTLAGQEDSSRTSSTEKSGSDLESYKASLHASVNGQRPEDARAAGSSEGTAIQSPRLETRKARILSRLECIFEDLSGLRLGDAASGVTFLEFGFDSLFLTQVSQMLHAEFGLKITFRQLLDQLATLDALAAYLDEKLPPQALPSGASDIAELESSRSEHQLPCSNEAGPAGGTRAATRPADAAVASAGGGPDLQLLFKTQLQTLSDLMAKQLEVLRNTETKAFVAVPDQITDPRTVHVATAQREPVDGLNGSAAVKLHGPTPRKFIPFVPVEAGKARELTPLQSQHLRALVESYSRKTAGSKRLTQQHRSHLADPRVAAGFRLQWKEIVYPIVTVRSSGSKLWDVDGNEYIDLVNGYGPIMFGHAPDFVNRAIREQLDHGYETGPQSPLAGKVADLICDMTGMERVTFCNTGSEAVTAALRVARTITARSKIVLFTGAYHGMFDEVVVKGVNGPNGPRSLPVAPGIPREKVENVIVLDYGTPEALRYIEAHAGELAAVLVEPVQSRHPALQPIDFLKEVRRITRQSGTALIFDEVVTGFRVHRGGCQALFGIKADLAIYGKVLGGGLPIGVLAGTSAFMDALDGGTWNYGDNSYPETGVTFFAGTFVRHPLALAAAFAVLNHLNTAGPELWEHLANKTTHMADALNALFEEREVQAHVDTFGSIAYFTLPAELIHAGLLYYYLRARGVHIQEGFPLFLTTAHSDEDIARVIQAFRESVLEIQAAGFLPAPHSEPMELPRNGSVSHLNGNGITPEPPEPGLTSIKENTHTVPVRQAPLTESQKEIWLSAKLSEQASCCYNESFTLKLRGNLDVAAFLAAVDRVVARHEALRAKFDANGEYQQFVPDPKLVIPIVDLTPLDGQSREKRLAQFIADDARSPFDLERGPLVRANLIVVRPGEYRFIFTAHHIVCDGWSTNIILDEVRRLYNAACAGRSYELPEPMTFGAYAESQAKHFQSSNLSALETYWQEQFSTLPAFLELPLDRPRPATRSYEGATCRLRIPAESYRDIKLAGAQQKCTLFVMLLAAFQILLSRLSGQEDIVIGIPAAGQAALDGESLVGHCVNFLPLRGEVVNSLSAAQYLAQVRRTLLDAYEHQNYTYGRLIRKLPIKRDPSRLPLTEVQFNLERMGSGIEFSGLELTIEPNAKSFVNQDLFLNIIESADGLMLDCDYNTGLFDQATIERWLGHYATLLGAMSADPNQRISSLPLLSTAEHQRIIASWNDTQAEFPTERCVHQLFEAQAQRTPDAVAVVYEGRQLTYFELNHRADQLARHLQKLGVGVGMLVGVFVERSLDMVTALLGVLKTGAAYVPMDPTYPAERISFVLEDAKVPILLTQESLARSVPPGSRRVLYLDSHWSAITREDSENDPRPTVSSEDLAYVIYTSGSTGKPKGVEIPHRAVVNLLHSMSKTPGLGCHDTLLAVTTLSFDIAALEIFLPLTVGAKMVIASRAEASDGSQLLARLRQSGATAIQATPVTFALLIEAGWAERSTLKVLCGGEALSRELATQLLERTSSVWNMYGPTETTIWSSAIRVEPGPGPVPIGFPIDNTQFYVLDQAGQLAPIGCDGELYIGGAGVARGYLHQQALTSEKFIRDPFRVDGNERLYRTGDRVRRLTDGTLEFVGRFDNQVKLRGFRIELGEIESALAKHPGVTGAAVILREDTPGDRRLVAYVVSNQQALTVTAVREFLIGKLPDYMLPSAVVRLDSMPLTPNGKLDRCALPAPATVQFSRSHEFVGPRTASERTLAEIWAEILHLERVGIRDDLFELGADSLHIFQIAARATRAGMRVAAPLFFKYRTIEGLLAHAENENQNGTTIPMPAIVPVSRAKYRLSQTIVPDQKVGSS